MTKDPRSLGDIDSAEFRRAGYQIIDWIAEYLDHPERYPVLSQVAPGDIKRGLPEAAPASPESIDAILRDFREQIIPGITHWNHPGFFAYFGISGSAPGILGELLMAALNVNAMMWRTSPAATELEERVLDWLRQMLGLPPSFEGVIMDTASISSMLAIAAARQRVPGLDVRRRGLSGRSDCPRLRAYVSDQTHSSVEKGAIILGLGQENVIKIASDDRFQMDVGELERAVAHDREAGYLPFFVCATVGTTSTTSVDPVAAIAAVAARHELWLHVDGAYGGIAAILPERREVFAGIEGADSVVVNPHKWLFTPIDLSAFYTRHLETLREAFSLVPEYLRSAATDSGQVRDYMDYGVQLGRRFRALKLWMVIRRFGVDGLAARIREHIRLAQLCADWIDDSGHFERLAPVPFSTVCFRAHPEGCDEATLDAINERLLNAVNDRGQVFLSHTRLNGRYALRLAIGNIRSDQAAVAQAWNQLQEGLADAINAARKTPES